MPQIRARDLRQMVSTHGFERGVVMAFEYLLEERVQEREHMRELTDLVSQCVDLVSQMVHAGDAMKTQLENLRRIKQQGDDHASGNVQTSD